MRNRKGEGAKVELLRKEGALNPRPEAVKSQRFQEGEFFDSRDLVQVKYEMLREVGVQKKSIKQTAAAFGFSRPSFYQARSVFDEEGVSGLLPRKRGPKGDRKLTPEVMDYVEKVRGEDGARNWAELAHLVSRRFGIVVNPRSIERKLVLRQKKLR